MNVRAILQAHERPWYEVQSLHAPKGDDGGVVPSEPDWHTIFEQRYGKGKWLKPEDAFAALERQFQRFPLTMSLNITYRIYCPQTGDVFWQGTLREVVTT